MRNSYVSPHTRAWNISCTQVKVPSPIDAVFRRSSAKYQSDDDASGNRCNGRPVMTFSNCHDCSRDETAKRFRRSRCRRVDATWRTAAALAAADCSRRGLPAVVMSYNILAACEEMRVLYSLTECELREVVRLLSTLFDYITTKSRLLLRYYVFFLSYRLQTRLALFPQGCG